VIGSLGVLAVLIWGGGRVLASMRQETEDPQDTAASVAATVTAAIPGLTEPAAPIAGEEATFSFTPGPTATAPDFIVGPSNLVDIRLVGEMRAWVRVTVDGQEQFSGRIAPGEILQYQGEQVVEVTTGNGAGVRVYYNGQDQGLLGRYSQVVIRLWNLSGAMTPTPTLQLTPTPTQTPQPSATPTQDAGP
jgi:hypothetical protein